MWQPCHGFVHACWMLQQRKDSLEKKKKQNLRFASQPEINVLQP